MGADKIKKRLEQFGLSQNLKLEGLEEGEKGSFRLSRDDKPAKNLSEGEKTIIAFSYFLTELEQISSEEKKEHVVFIDDPISSFDENHLYSCAQVLREVFLDNEKQDEKWNKKWRQVFISTHNFNFFRRLALGLQKTEKVEDEKIVIGATWEIIRNREYSSIQKMKIGHYSTEYQYICSKVKEINDDLGKNNVSTGELLEYRFEAANLLRRLVESFTHFHFSQKDAKGKKKELFGNYSILNAESHNTNTNDISPPDELQTAYNGVLKQIEKWNPSHYDSHFNSNKGSD